MTKERPDRQSGGIGNRTDDQRAGRDAGECAGERHRPDLASEPESDLPAARAAREQPASLAREPASKPNRGDDRETEEERARLSADQGKTIRRDLPAPCRIEQRLVRTAQPERGVGG